MTETILDIYRRYRIMPNLQLHMLRVAGVAQNIIDSLDVPVARDHIIKACLLHDMGNILKFNLGLFPDFLEPEGLVYWQNVKMDFAKRYGPDEHVATLKIAEEIKVASPVEVLIEAIGFSHGRDNFESKDLNRKICAYADLRVTPFGVTSLKHRLEEGSKRWKLNKGKDPFTKDIFHDQAPYFPKIEAQIFSHSSLQPSTITDSSVNDTIETLKTVTLPE